MKMVIGGAYQGKTDYAKQVYPNLVWSDGASCDLKDIFSCSGIVHFEEFVRRWIRENKAEHATDLAEQILQENPDTAWFRWMRLKDSTGKLWEESVQILQPVQTG